MLAFSSLRARARAASILVALSSVALGPATAAAQPANEAASAYKQHMENGVKLFQDKNFEAAIVEFRAAYEAHAKASPLVNIALAYKGLFNYPKAIQALETALARHGDSMDAADRKAAHDAIAEMKGLLAYVNVAVRPAQATITVDGEDQPASSASSPVPLGPGTHKIGAHLDGYAPAEKSVTVASGDRSVSVRLVLVPDKGYVSVKGDTAATVIAIDETRVGTGSWAGLLAPGTHVVELSAAGVSPYRTNIVVVAGQAQTIRRGVGGAPVVVASTVGKTPAPVVTPPPAPPKAPPKPPVRGPYALATGGLLAPMTAPKQAFPEMALGTGAAGGVRVGYRVNTAAAFELMFEYGNVRTGTHDDSDDARMSLSSTRFGANLKLMTPSPRVRFFGTLGGGFVYDDLTVESRDGGRCVGENSCSGYDPYFSSELGIEIEIGGVLIGAAGRSLFQATKGIDDADPNAYSTSPYADDPVWILGAGLHVGYALW
jgi:hypothetical protein